MSQEFGGNGNSYTCFSSCDFCWGLYQISMCFLTSGEFAAVAICNLDYTFGHSEIWIISGLSVQLYKVTPVNIKSKMCFSVQTVQSKRAKRNKKLQLESTGRETAAKVSDRFKSMTSTCYLTREQQLTELPTGAWWHKLSSCHKAWCNDVDHQSICWASAL